MTFPPTVLQAFRFTVVGGAATVTHVTIFVALTAIAHASALLANALAWAIAFIASFLGHYYWTFRNGYLRNAHTKSVTIIRFLAIALLGLALNSLVVLLVVELAKLPSGIAAFFMATVVPTILFLFNRFWVFL